MGILFGTDGVRGIANRELTPELAYLGRAGSYVLVRISTPYPGRERYWVSGDMLEGSVAGICSMGASTKSGVVPTPAVAYLTREFRHPVGWLYRIP